MSPSDLPTRPAVECKDSVSLRIYLWSIKEDLKRVVQSKDVLDLLFQTMNMYSYLDNLEISGVHPEEDVLESANALLSRCMEYLRKEKASEVRSNHHVV